MDPHMNPVAEYIITYILKDVLKEDKDLSYLCKFITDLYNIDHSLPRQFLFMKQRNCETSIYQRLWRSNYINRSHILDIFNPTNYESIDPILSMVSDVDNSSLDHRITLAIARTGHLMCLKNLFDATSTKDLLDFMFATFETHKWTHFEMAHPTEPTYYNRYNQHIQSSKKEHKQLSSSYIKLVKYFYERCINDNEITRFHQVLNLYDNRGMDSQPVIYHSFTFCPDVKIAKLMIEIAPWSENHKEYDIHKSILNRINDIKFLDSELDEHKCSCISSYHSWECKNLLKWVELRNLVDPDYKLTTKGIK